MRHPSLWHLGLGIGLWLGSVAVAQGPTVVQEAANSAGSISTLTVTLGRLPTPGNVLIVCHDVSSTSNSVVSGGGVLTWTMCETSLPEKTNSQIWAGVVGPSPAADIQIRLGSAPNWASGHVAEWSGVATPLDFESTSTYALSEFPTANVVSGTVSANAGDLIVATVGVHGTGQSITLPTHSFTDMVRSAPLSGTTMATAYRVPTAAGNYFTTWTLGYRRGWASAIIRFRAANPGGGGPQPPAAPTLVQQSTNAGAAIGTLTVTLPSLPTAGNVLVISHDSTSGGLSRISGGGVTNWVLCGHSLPDQDNSEIFAGVVDGTPSSTITVRLGGSPNSAVANVTEWTGLQSPVQFDAVDTFSTVKTRPAVTGAVNAAAGDLVIATVGVHASSMAIGLPTNGFTDLTRMASGGSSVMAAGYKIATAAGPQSTQWDMSFTHRWATVIAVFRKRQ